MARNRKPGLVRRIVGIPGYMAKKPVKTAWTATKVAVIGTALLGAALYAYTTFSPKYESGADIKSGIEKIADDATNAFNDARNIADYVRNEEKAEYRK